MTREKLMAALESAERPERPSRELDCDIWQLAGDKAQVVEIPRYTSSLDAALTLVPKGHEALVYTTGAARVWPIEGKRSGDLSYGRTPAIALCIAALKARGVQD